MGRLEVEGGGCHAYLQVWGHVDLSGIRHEQHAPQQHGGQPGLLGQKGGGAATDHLEGGREGGAACRGEGLMEEGCRQRCVGGGGRGGGQHAGARG